MVHSESATSSRAHNPLLSIVTDASVTQFTSMKEAQAVVRAFIEQCVSLAQEGEEKSHLMLLIEVLIIACTIVLSFFWVYSTLCQFTHFFVGIHQYTIWSSGVSDILCWPCAQFGDLITKTGPLHSISLVTSQTNFSCCRSNMLL